MNYLLILKWAPLAWQNGSGIYKLSSLFRSTGVMVVCLKERLMSLRWFLFHLHHFSKIPNQKDEYKLSTTFFLMSDACIWNLYFLSSFWQDLVSIKWMEDVLFVQNPKVVAPKSWFCDSGWVSCLAYPNCLGLGFCCSLECHLCTWLF